MSRSNEVRKLYEGMTSAQIAERLASGNVSEIAVKIGTQILSERGEDPALAIEQAAGSTQPVEDVGIIKGKNGKVCPFCHCTKISGAWTPTCTNCGATYDNHKIERALFVSAILMAFKGYRLNNHLLLIAGIAGMIVLSGIAINRGTMHGTWYRRAEPESPSPF